MSEKKKDQMTAKELYLSTLTLILLLFHTGQSYALGSNAALAKNEQYSGTARYVANAPLGNDDNPGTETEPWAHCPGMPGWTGNAVLQPGDIVYFASSGVWETSEGNALLQISGGVVYDGSSWGTGERATLRMTGYVRRSVINVMEDHPELPTVIRGFHVDSNGQVVSGITVNWPHSQGNMTGAVKRIEDCIVHGVYSESNQGQHEYGILISSGWGGDRHVSNVEILNCEVYNISRGGINVYAANDDPASSISNVLVRGNTVYATGTDPQYAGSTMAVKNHTINIIVEHNVFRDPERGIGIGISTHPEEGFRGPENLVIRNNIITNSAHAGMFIQGHGGMSMDIYGNIIARNRYHGINFTQGLTGNISARIYNNTFYENYYEDQWGDNIRIHNSVANYTTLEFVNNIVYAAGNVVNTRCLMDDAERITLHSNNIYYHPGGGTLIRSPSGTSYSASNISIFEPTALSVDPLFVNPGDIPTRFLGGFGADIRPNTEGFNISEFSEARDAGMSLGTPYNTSINGVVRPMGNSWDIGAYEYTGTTFISDKNVPDNMYLYQNFPNPFNPVTNIEYHVPESQRVNIKIYDILGREVTTLVNEYKSAGKHTVLWDGKNTAGQQVDTGVYFYRLSVTDSQGNNFFHTRKMLMIK
jgi:hypothetical protein